MISLSFHRRGISSNHHYYLLACGLVLICFILTTNIIRFDNDNNHRSLVQLMGKGWIRDPSTRQGKLVLFNSEHERSLLHRRKEEAMEALRAGEFLSLHKSNVQNHLVIYSIFAGRRDALQVQIPYITDLVKQGIVDEVHIWDYTCKQYMGPAQSRSQKVSKEKEYIQPSPEAILNAQFLRKELMTIDSRIYLVRPNLCIWEEYYNFYGEILRDMDVLLKVDDDIVFVDTSRVSGFVRTIRNFPDIFLWSANVINNGIAAGLQQRDGLLPPGLVDMETEIMHSLGEGCLFRNTDNGRRIHELFLQDPLKFIGTEEGPTQLPELRLLKTRLSINFIGFLGRNIARAGEYVTLADGDDELGLTKKASERKDEKIILYTPLVVSHASFSPQRMGWKIYELYETFYNKYQYLRFSNQNNATDTWIAYPETFVIPERYNE